MGRKHFVVGGGVKGRRYGRLRPYGSVGKYLAAARKKAGLTQRKVSLALGYSSAQFISNFERGIAVPTLKKLRRMQRLYKMNVPELVEVLMLAKRELLAKRLLEGNKQKPKSLLK